MSSESLQRRVITTLAITTTAVATAYLVYRNYSISHGSSSPQRLHRSNAVRRPRRQPAEPDLNALHTQQSREQNSIHRHALDAALMHLNSPAYAEASYGLYENETLIPPLNGEIALPLDLSLQTLPALLGALLQVHPNFTVLAQDSLRQHIQGYFVTEFILSFFNDGHQFSTTARDELENALARHNISPQLTRAVLAGISSRDHFITNEWSPTHVIDEDGAREETTPNPAQFDGVVDDPMSIDEPIGGSDDIENGDRGHNMLNLLYHIAREQAKQNGYVHRSVECNSCGACPIQGVRYHCANCFDYDLCETCEAKEVHIKTHVFYKIRIPAPSRGQIKAVAPKWYPGNPNGFPPSLPAGLMEQLKTETGLDQPDIRGLYEHFKCLAGHPLEDDPELLGYAIDRQAFDAYFIPSYADHPTPANLIYDRVFAFYDENDDGLIDFLEFVRGISKLNDKSFMARLKRMFKGYDLDADGYVCRKDFLRMFRAYYDLTTQLNREMFYSRNEEMDVDDEIREVVNGNHPISAAFGGNHFAGHLSRSGQDKTMDTNGDLVIANGPQGVLQDDLDMAGQREKAVSMVPFEARDRHPFRSFRQDQPRDEPAMHATSNRGFELLSITNAQDADDEEVLGPNPPFHTYGWPPVMTPQPEDVIAALGADIPLDQIDDPVDRSRVIYHQSERFDNEFANRRNAAQSRAANDRWRRRQFYLDEEEGMTRPAAYTEPDSSEDESDGPEPETIDDSRGQSLRSRSSSKVRFEDSAIDTDYETRSNASSRSVPQNERWGGFELSRPTLDVGADVLYGAVQQGFNELVDCLFKVKEDQALAAQSTRKQRLKWEAVLDEYSENRHQDEEDREEALIKADSLRTEELLKGNSEESERTLDLSITGEAANMPLVQDAIASMRSELTRVIKEVTQLSREASPRPPIIEVTRDPTLPQFRPDYDHDKVTSNGVETTASKPDDSPPSKRTLALWLKHRRIDAEAEIRGGYGRLNLMEFRKAVEAANEGDRDETFDGRSRDSKKKPLTSQPTDENDGQYWEKNPDLGTLAFLGTWLEMALF